MSQAEKAINATLNALFGLNERFKKYALHKQSTRHGRPQCPCPFDYNSSGNDHN